MISNVPDETSETVFADAVWCETHNRHASAHVNIRTTNATVPLLGHDFKMQFERPLVKDHHCEFEDYFGFGGHCKGFNVNRTIARFPSKFDAAIDIDELLQCSTDPIDTDYAKRAIVLLALGGYVSYGSQCMSLSSGLRMSRASRNARVSVKPSNCWHTFSRSWLSARWSPTRRLHDAI